MVTDDSMNVRCGSSNEELGKIYCPDCGYEARGYIDECPMCGISSRYFLEKKVVKSELPTPILIEATLGNLATLLVGKNKKYGDSALKPANIFSKLDATNSICIRLDDKISRVKNSEELRKNDVCDLMGYLTLLCVANGWTDFKEFDD